MIIHNQPVYLVRGETLVPLDEAYHGPQSVHGLTYDLRERTVGRGATIASRILAAHTVKEEGDRLSLNFDVLASHDITYVSIVQAARSSGLEAFEVPYVLTNCHNSLCAVGGTINEDDHLFGLQVAKKYGGIFVPAFQAVIHQYIREMHAAGGSMVLGSDSHTRYGALGCMGFGEGGPELVKQLLGRSYDIKYPKIIAVYLHGAPPKGVGPQDVALALVKEVFDSGLAKNTILEFVGPGISNLSVDFRNSLDTMTTETTCLSSIWTTDDRVREYYALHGRPEAYVYLSPGPLALYDGAIQVDLSKIEPMIGLPFHPSNAWSIAEFKQNSEEILTEAERKGREQLEQDNLHFSLKDKLIDGVFHVDQGSISGCAGGSFENLSAVADILEGGMANMDRFWLSAYPSSQPISLQLMTHGIAERLMACGVTLHPAYCGSCFGAGDTPADGALSIRHVTRNFPHREGSKPLQNQVSMVALMDARSIAATARNNGALTAATELDVEYQSHEYTFNDSSYRSRVFNGFGNADPDAPLIYGPNIKDWPQFFALENHLLLTIAASIDDEVTTTDELIPSGETSSYRSNPRRLAQYFLSRKVPEYVGRSEEMLVMEEGRRHGEYSQLLEDLHAKVVAAYVPHSDLDIDQFYHQTGFGSAIFARKPGDGSAREQAASSQRILGGMANFAIEYATKRYQSNLLNWGIFPFLIDEKDRQKLSVGTTVFIPNLRVILEQNKREVPILVIQTDQAEELVVQLPDLTMEERQVLLAGCLMNYYRKEQQP